MNSVENVLVVDGRTPRPPTWPRGAARPSRTPSCSARRSPRAARWQETLQRFMARRFERVRLVIDTSVELGRMMRRGDPVPAQNALRATAMAALASRY